MISLPLPDMGQPVEHPRPWAGGCQNLGQGAGGTGKGGRGHCEPPMGEHESWKGSKGYGVEPFPFTLEKPMPRMGKGSFWSQSKLPVEPG